MPTPSLAMSDVDIATEEPGITFRYGVRSPATGRQQVIVDMDVIINVVRGDGDWMEGDDTVFTKRVGEHLASRLLPICVRVINHQTGDLNAAFTQVGKEVTARPASDQHPYSGALRYVGEFLDVILIGTDKSQWLIRDKEGKGFSRFFWEKKTNKPLRIPAEWAGEPLWPLISFCAHRECHLDAQKSPGCPCVCHIDGRNHLMDVPLEELVSDNIDELILKWTGLVEVVLLLLMEEAQRDNLHHDEYLGQIEGIDTAFEWLLRECYDETEWVFMGALTVSMFSLLKHWVTF